MSTSDGQVGETRLRWFGCVQMIDRGYTGERMLKIEGRSMYSGLVRQRRKLRIG